MPLRVGKLSLRVAMRDMRDIDERVLNFQRYTLNWLAVSWAYFWCIFYELTLMNPPELNSSLTETQETADQSFTIPSENSK